MKSAFALMLLKVQLIKTRHSMDSPTQVWACNAAVIISDTIRKEATSGHVTVKTFLVVVFFAMDLFLLIFNVFYNPLKGEPVLNEVVVFVCLIGWHAFG